MFFANFLHYVLAFEFNLIVITVLCMLCQMLYNNWFLKSITLRFSFPFPELKFYINFFVKLKKFAIFISASGIENNFPWNWLVILNRVITSTNIGPPWSEIISLTWLVHRSVATYLVRGQIIVSTYKYG